MKEPQVGAESPRRRFIKAVAGATGVIPVHALAAAQPLAPATTSAGPEQMPDGYQFFRVEEAAVVEALVNTLCPADDLTPDGVSCGPAIFMDRQLAGGFGIHFEPIRVCSCRSPTKHLDRRFGGLWLPLRPSWPRLL